MQLQISDSQSWTIGEMLHFLYLMIAIVLFLGNKKKNNLWQDEKKTINVGVYGTSMIGGENMISLWDKYDKDLWNNMINVCGTNMIGGGT